MVDSWSRVSNIIPAHLGYQAGKLWLNDGAEADLASATVEDVEYRVEPIIAWAITAEFSNVDGEPQENQYVRAIGVNGDIAGEYFVMLPDGRAKLRYDDPVGSLTDVKQAYLDMRKRQRAVKAA